MGCDEDVVGAEGSIPEREFVGDDFHGGGEQRPSVSDRRKAVDLAEVARDVDGDEEEVRFVRVKRPYIAGQQSSVDRDLGSEEVTRTPFVGEPIGVELWR